MNRNREMLLSSQGQDGNQMVETAGSSHAAKEYSPPPILPTGPSKLALLRGGQQGGDTAMTQGSSSSILNLLMSPTQMSSGAYNTRSATQSYQDSDYSREDDISRQPPLQPQQSHPNDPTGLGGAVNPRRSISARTLAQELAPHLSDHDIIRLADNIVARMQLTGAAIHSEQNSRIVAGENESEFSVDPPPPWRASWTGGPVGGNASRTNA